MLVEALKKRKPSSMSELAKHMRASFEACDPVIPRKGVLKYLPLKKFYELPLRPCENSVYGQEFDGICFYNGFYQGSQGVESAVEVLSFQEAMDIYSLELSDYFQNIDQGIFSKMALAYPQSGVCIYVPANLKVDKPINLDFILDEANGYSSPLIKVFVAKGASVAFTSRFNDKESLGMQNAHFHIELASNATVDWVNIRKFHNPFTLFETFRVSQAKESQFNYTSMTNGSTNYWQNIEAFLEGARADCNVKGFYTLKNKDQAHVHVDVRHKDVETTSNQFFRGLLADESMASFRGNIFVEKKGQKTDAYQLCNHLMIGQKAKAIAEPNLEIFADDVKASHGATMKRVDDQDLFYLKSRGISEELAVKILARGFCVEPLEGLDEVLKKEALGFFNG